jgi:hypothetical protein
MSERKQFYNPMIDPTVQVEKMTPKMRQAVQGETYGAGGPLNAPDAAHPANLVSSLCEDDLHRPALDIDIPCRVVPSATEGHCHIYFDTVALSWRHYKNLLDALADAGILDESYVEASKARGQTLLRPEGVAKGKATVIEPPADDPGF